MAHFEKPNLKQRIALSGNTCPTCKDNGNGSGLLVRKDTPVLSRTFECKKCGDSFVKSLESNQ